MQLVRLRPDQCSRFWNVIRASLEEVLPPVQTKAHNALPNILEALMLEKAQCWMYVRDEGDCGGIMVTEIQYNAVTRRKSLFIMSLLTMKNAPFDAWKHGHEVLSNFAKAHGCHSVTAMSARPEMVKLAERIGGKSWHYLDIPLK